MHMKNPREMENSRYVNRRDELENSGREQGWV